MLEVNGVSVSYGPVQALQDVSLSVRPGQITAVIGANGAGKSTLMRTLAGLVKPNSGTWSLNGRVLTGMKPEEIVRAGVSLVPEGRSTIPDLTVEENLSLGALWRSKGRRQLGITEVYRLFPVLEERADKGADTLSGGERQQLAIGRALMSGPQVLMLDEPSLGLAPLIVTQILDMVSRLARDTNLAVLLVEQNAVSALRVAREGIVLNLGQIVTSGRAADLVSDEQLRHAYLGY
jgi:branched-chain amino acid transport system ATP-binding protein